MTTDITKDAGYKGVFPSSFLYGCASASYQIEGGWNAEGKGEGVWDRALKDAADNGEDACDSYHLWKDDIKLLKRYGCNTYRFSISWPRVRPQGGASDPVNEAGIKYYSDLIDALIAEGITPCVTIFHWDHPQALEDEYGSFSNTERIVKDFGAFAELLFQRFGDRVKNWITINEPHIFTMLSSFVFRAGKWKGTEDTAKLAKTLLLCHGRTVELYRSKYQPEQKGKIAITLNVDWVEPIDDSKEAKDAAQLNLDWVVGLYADPVYLGRFPQVCLDSPEAAPHLTFTDDEWAAVKGSSDFFGLNHYGSAYTTGAMVDPKTAEGPRALAFGPAVKVTEKDGKPIGNKGHNGHPFDVPWGFRKLLQYLHKRYTSPSVNGIPITITENGFATQDEANLSLEERINDVQRQTYYRGYLKELIEAQRDDGIEIGGYMAWSLLDNLEWSFGYAPRFGVTIVDRENGFKRTPKDSAYVLRDIFAHAIKA